MSVFIPFVPVSIACFPDVHFIYICLLYRILLFFEQCSNCGICIGNHCSGTTYGWFHNPIYQPNDRREYDYGEANYKWSEQWIEVDWFSMRKMSPNPGCDVPHGCKTRNSSTYPNKLAAHWYHF